jgi:nitric oxide reductase NorQ protein
MNGNGQSLAVAPDASASSSLAVEASDHFVMAPPVKRLTDRALTYLNAGYPVHFSGPAGTGKTTLALHLAALRSRPVTLMHGDDELGSSDLIGADTGYRKSKLIDNFIHSVVRTEETMSTLWADNRLTLACKKGDTLVYDEFTRSRPEANNALLSVLEERLLTLPTRRPHGDGYLEVHPDFRAIFTSNPEEYAGVHRTQDALLDRLITIRIDYYDRETEVAITRTKSGIARGDAEVVVDIVRELRSLGVAKQGPSLRACIMIARVLAAEGGRAHQDDSIFPDVCRDVLTGLSAKVVRAGGEGFHPAVDQVIRKHLKQVRRPSREIAETGASQPPALAAGEEGGQS